MRLCNYAAALAGLFAIAPVLANCNKNGAAKTEDPSSSTPTTALTDKSSAPSAPTARVDSWDAADLNAEQKRILGILRTAKDQHEKDWAPEVQPLLEKIKPGWGVFKGLTRGQLIRALGKPNEPHANQPKNTSTWTIGAPPVGLKAAPVLAVSFDDDGQVREQVGVRFSM